MARQQRPSASLWRKAFQARTKAFREDAGLSQDQVALALGISQGRYNNYETKRPLPHEMIEAFCIIVDCDVRQLYPEAKRRRQAV